MIRPRSSPSDLLIRASMTRASSSPRSGLSSHRTNRSLVFEALFQRWGKTTPRFPFLRIFYDSSSRSDLFLYTVSPLDALGFLALHQRLCPIPFKLLARFFPSVSNIFFPASPPSEIQLDELGFLELCQVSPAFLELIAVDGLFCL